MNKKIFAFLISSILSVTMISSTVVSAETNFERSELPTDISVCSEGLISRIGLSISKSGSKILLNGKTVTAEEMRYIGLKNIKIQRSADSVSGWYDYITTDLELIADNSTIYITTDYELATVPNGYYRVVLDHYAQKNWLIGPSESINNTSNSISIP